MSEEEKPAKSFEEKDENVEREDRVHTQQSSLSEKKGEIQQVRYRKGEKIKRIKYIPDLLEMVCITHHIRMVTLMIMVV